MRDSRFIRITLVLSFFFTLCGCGKKGNLVPPEALVPAPVKDLAVAQKGGSFLASWSAPTKQEGGRRLKDLAGFLLFRRVALPAGEDCESCPGAFTQIAKIDLDYLGQAKRIGDRFYYEDHDLKEGQSYQYTVRSRTTEGELSRDSNRVRRTVFLPPLPPVLEVKPSADFVTLSFVAIPPQQGKLVGYNVYRTSAGQPMPTNPLTPAPVTGNSYRDSSLLLGQRYDYTVRSVAAMADGETVESIASNLAEGALAPPD